MNSCKVCLEILHKLEVYATLHCTNWKFMLHYTAQTGSLCYIKETLIIRNGIRLKENSSIRDLWTSFKSFLHSHLIHHDESLNQLLKIAESN